MKKLALITTTMILRLINFISLTTKRHPAPFKKMTRDNPRINYYKSEDSKSKTKPKRRNSTKRLMMNSAPYHNSIQKNYQ